MFEKVIVGKVFMNKVFIKTSVLILVLLCFSLAFISYAQQKKNSSKQEQAKPKTTPTSKTKSKQTKPTTPKPSETPVVIDATASDTQDLETIKNTINVNERIEKLKAFIQERPNSTVKLLALELLSSSRAELGDSRLRFGDNANGVELFRLAVSEAPENSSDDFFAKVLSQIPTNLFWRSEQKAALEIAKLVEDKVKNNPTRLLAIEAFYLGIEDSENALRLAQQAVKLAPDMSAAHQGLGAAYRISFRLDEAAEAYAKAAELDPNSATARRSLADMRRAQGRDEEAMLLYRGLVQTNKDDEFSRIGLVVSLLNMNKREDAEKEFIAAIESNPNSFGLLANVAYWYAAHNESEKALEMAQKAVQAEPRYVWSHVALARALVATKQPLDAEKALLYAKQYGSFPTLDYELATVMASMGLYDEATRTLSRSFTLKDGMLETKLGNRAPVQASNFIELLAPERRVSIFQSGAADTEANAKLLKSLLAFSAAINPTGGKESRKETEVVAAAKDLASGDDAMKTHRQLYVASRLIQNDVALPQASELAQAATVGLEASLDVPAPTVAVMADDLYDVRARASSYGGTASIPDLQRNMLSNIMRGRVEQIAGLSLFSQNKPAEATIRLKRAVGVLPENSVWWRNAMWYLGAAQEANGNQQEALAAYYKSYNSNPDSTRRVIIEALYRKVNGTLDGLDNKIGPSPNAPKVETNAPAINTASTENTKVSSTPNPVFSASQQKENQLSVLSAKPTPTPETKPETSLTKTENKSEPIPSPTPVNEPKTESSAPANTEAKPDKTPQPKTENKTEDSSAAVKSNEVKQEEPKPQNENKESVTPTPSPSPSPEEKPSQDQVAKNDTKTNETAPASQTETKPQTEIKTEPTPKTDENASPTNKAETPATSQPENKTENKTEDKIEDVTVSKSRPRVAKEKSGDASTVQKTDLPKQETETPEQKPEPTTEQKQMRPRVAPSNEQASVETTDKQRAESTESKTATDGKTCTVSVNQEEVSIINNGGTIAVTITLDGMPLDEKKISVDFDWANINVFLEPNVKSDGHSALYKIVSSSKNTGTYKITFKTPCGLKDVTVNVR